MANHFLSCLLLGFSIGVSLGVVQYTVPSEFYDILKEALDGGIDVAPEITKYPDGHYSISVTTSKGTHELKNVDESLLNLFVTLFENPNVVITKDSQSGSDVTISVSASGSEEKLENTSYNAVCTSKCQQLGKKYHWCYTDKKKYGFYWDYCNASPGKTSLGRDCKSDSACGAHGYKYNWCYTTTGRWDYCVPN